MEYGARRRMPWLSILFAIVAVCLAGVKAQEEEHSKVPLPSYHYGAKIPVECLNRSM